MISETYTRIDVASWKRKEHFEKWISFDEPFHGISVRLELTNCYNFCSSKGYKIFHRYMYHFINTINEIEPMKYRLKKGLPVVFDQVLSGLVIAKPDETFAYGQLTRSDNFKEFSNQIEREKKRIIERGTLHDSETPLNLTHFSVLPWTNFTGLSHARKYGTEDSIPKVTFGKITKIEDSYSMPMAVHVHHALVDGKDVADFINLFQEKLLENK